MRLVFSRSAVRRAKTKKCSFRILGEGGGAFVDVQQVRIDDLREAWPQLVSDLTQLGVEDVQPIGTTMKKNVMGDIDVVVKYSKTRDDLLIAARKKFGPKNAIPVGATIVSVSYPMPQGYNAQLDLMIGDAQYVSWARYGGSPEQGHPEHTPFKGVARNFLLNAITRVALEEMFPGQSTETERTRYTFDYDKGLFRSVQSRMGGHGKPTKNWKTLERELVSSDPVEIVQILFGEDANPSSMLTVDDVVDTLLRSPLKHLASRIVDEWIAEGQQMLARKPDKFGDPAAVQAGFERIRRKVSGHQAESRRRSGSILAAWLGDPRERSR